MSKSPDAESRLVAERYGLDVAGIEPLQGEADRTFLVATTNGDRFVLKVSAEPDRQRLENQLLEHLNDAASSEIEAPVLVGTVDGDDTVVLHDGQGSARLTSWIPGTMLADLAWHSPELLFGLGELAGRLALALADFDDPALDRSHDWDLRTAPTVIRRCLPAVVDSSRRADAEQFLALWDSAVAPRLGSLPTAICHQDLNDFNVLTRPDDAGSHHVVGVLDFGDALRGLRVAEVAVAAAYAMLRKQDPLSAAGDVVAGFNSLVPLRDEELTVLFPLAALRLCANASVWTQRLMDDPGLGYATARSQHTWRAIRVLADIEPAEAEGLLRWRCGREPYPVAAKVTAWLADATPAPITDSAVHVADHFVQTVGAVTRSGVPSRDEVARRRSGANEPTTVRLGSDVALPAGTPVRTPFPATVASQLNGVLVLDHATEDGTPFHTLYRGVAATVTDGASLAAGEQIGLVGDRLHVQISCMPGLPPLDVRPSRFGLWASRCPDPAVLLFCAPVDDHWRARQVLDVRDRRVARSQRAYYRDPPLLARSHGVWLTDEDGLSYLDAVNNVSHVGHCHPRIVEAAYRQMQRLNTNSRFLYDGLARYAVRLASTLPDPLDVVFFVCTGSEANDLAVRMARTCTGRDDLLVIDGAYHGNTTTVTGISPNRYKGPGGTGAPPTTHEVPQPNRYRGPFGYADPAAGARYAVQGRDVLDQLVAKGQPPAAFIAESLIGTGGQVVLPDGYLRDMFAAVRKAGGLCISDEIQVGLGRLGAAFWGFELQGVVPDIVTIGKPLGNGHPIAAVVTTRQIADTFDNGMKYFNTFGGNPVSCAIGMAVLDVIDDERLQDRAINVGWYFQEQLRCLQREHEIIGDIRGAGLYIGIELVRDRTSKEPATAAAYRISERMKDEGVIVYPNGAFDNVLKLKPPMIFDSGHADIVVETLDQILREGW